MISWILLRRLFSDFAKGALSHFTATKTLNTPPETPTPRTEVGPLPFDEYYQRALSLISEHEGSEDHYYSLPSIYDKSGATVGRGVDFGQHSKADLERLGVPETIIRKVGPLLGVKNKQGDGAVDEAISRATPLESEEIDLLNEAFYRENVDRLISDLGPSVSDINPDLFAHLASAYYRGGLKPGHDTFKLIRAGQYADAAKEFLRNDEYDRLKASNPDDGVVRRMDEMANVLKGHSVAFKRGGKVRDIYGRSYI
jgi:GH24 family phage-related lysozyme (muramidase)